MIQEADIYLFIIMVLAIIGIAWIFRPKRFNGGVFFNDDLKLTEIVLRDTAIVWEQLPCGLEGHWVDLGYDFDGNLVAIRIWDDVRYRKTYGMRKSK
jgi:hypothetical protein